MAMTDLADWLLAQIKEDEATARAAIVLEHKESGHWCHPEEYDRGQVEDRGSNDIIVYDEGRPTDAQADHIARHDPARVLAECAAKRAIVEEWRKHEERTRWALAHELDPSHPDQRRNAVWTVLHLLAQPYADRPGFDPAWKVGT